MRIVLLTLLGLFPCVGSIHAEEPFKLPPGFEAIEYANPTLANDIFTLHIDRQSRVVVSGPGYVRELVDADGDGVAEKSREVIAGLKQGAMGLLWEEETLFVVADGGLQRYTNVNGLSPSRERTTIVKLKTGSEHDAHAVKRGPDGHLYVICGNQAGANVQAKLTPGGPIAKPIAGVLLRIDETNNSVEVVADGFRNAYDFDFNLLGDAFTFDSDNERCVGLPWYEPTRFYHVREGGHHGWLNPQHAETFRLPPDYPDVAMPVCTVGRGSPTGVACYRQTHFPKHYQGGFFLADWTFGNIWFVPLIEENGTYVGKPELFLEANGDNGFAPTGLAVSPKTGELFISIGGRGTRGAVYRIRHKSNPGQPIAIVPRDQPMPKPVNDELIATLRSMQLETGGLVAPSERSSVWAGYSFRREPSPELVKEMLDYVHANYPTTDPIQNRELSRMLGALQDDSIASMNTVAAQLDLDSHPIDDIHHLIVLARLKAKRSPAVTRRVANALMRLDDKFNKRELLRDRNWPLRLRETVTLLLERDPNLADLLLDHPWFARSGESWLASHPKIDQRKAALRIFAQAQATTDYQWSPELIERLGTLPLNDIKPTLDRIWTEGIYRDSVIPIIATKPNIADRERFVEALSSLNTKTVRLAAKALTQLKPDETVLLPTLRSWRRFSNQEKTEPTQRSLAELLQAIGRAPSRTTLPQWEAWLMVQHPALAATLNAGGSATIETLRQRFQTIDMSSGDAKRGELVYRKASCASCHEQGNAVGPTLAGVTKRFGKDDLIAAVINPNRDVPDRYQTVQINTLDGRTVEGIVIYQAVDGVILQTDATTTLRIAGDNIDTQRKLSKSLMPGGLLDPLTDQEIADLFAFLHQPAKL